MAVISNNNIFSSTPFPPLVDPTLALISLRDPKLYLFKVPLFVAPPKEKKTPRHLCAKVYFTLNEPFSPFSSFSSTGFYLFCAGFLSANAIKILFHNALVITFQITNMSLFVVISFIFFPEIFLCHPK